ncbi:hypothetical protein B2J93_5661 [Marssonina coronariae]|uniref:Uncharacterized protein n=1 Tax=Diplocarpon coronariae TaxID=2795749 RepID=A0A218ZC97_9HELO|nr:hypothetical protein B2J93_5661 [Marssonina coronariae]
MSEYLRLVRRWRAATGSGLSGPSSPALASPGRLAGAEGGGWIGGMAFDGTGRGSPPVPGTGIGVGSALDAHPVGPSPRGGEGNKRVNTALAGRRTTTRLGVGPDERQRHEFELDARPEPRRQGNTSRVSDGEGELGSGEG